MQQSSLVQCAQCTEPTKISVELNRETNMFFTLTFPEISIFSLKKLVKRKFYATTRMRYIT